MEKRFGKWKGSTHDIRCFALVLMTRIVTVVVLIQMSCPKSGGACPPGSSMYEHIPMNMINTCKGGNTGNLRFPKLMLSFTIP